MRRQRRTFAEIGSELSISAQQAHRLYVDHLRREPVQELTEFRVEELALIDNAVSDLLTIARDRGESGRTRIEAWNGICRWAERRARLCGLDAPTRSHVEVVTEDAVAAAIRQLESEIAANDALEAAEAALKDGRL